VIDSEIAPKPQSLGHEYAAGVLMAGLTAWQYDYQNNLKEYPTWHEYFRINQPPTLVAWGKNDIFFGPQGALAFQKDIKDAEIHLLNTGHFPLEEDLDVSA
jgi:pimeloyl-ACP methyl ester carboxylesterase